MTMRPARGGEGDDIRNSVVSAADEDSVRDTVSLSERGRKHRQDPQGTGENSPESSQDEGLTEASHSDVTEDRNNNRVALPDGEVAQIHEIVQNVIAEKFESYSGLLPHPEHWNGFDQQTQERILRMSEAYTTDESCRRDRIVDAGIVEAKNGRRNAIALIVLCVVVAGGLVVHLDNPAASYPFLALPLMAVIRDFLKSRNNVD